ncbi:MAG: hypothetical protein KFF73_11620 [Cyclobacteriaceae bacterium]|nr:hypothetical protein [Cyclobacteriaceae bacterium]
MKTRDVIQLGSCMSQFARFMFLFSILVFFSSVFNASLTIAQNVGINDISPASMCVGQTVTINGRNLDKVNRIRFNDVLLELSDGDFTIEKKNTITFPAPADAVTNGTELVTTMIYIAGFGILPADVYNQDMSINPLPAAPVNPSGSSYCEGSTVSSVSVNNPGGGFRIDWYDSPTGGSPLGSGASFTPPGPGTYYAERVNVNTGCISPTRVSATVKVLPSPEAPSGANNSEYCEGDPVSTISVNNPGGGFRIDWYNTASGGNLIGSGTSLTPPGPGTYYAETFNTTSLCSSSSRTPVTVTRNAAPPAPSGAKGSSYCSGDPVSSVSVNNPGEGFRIDWYDSKSGGTLLGSGTTFTPAAPGTFYAETFNTSTSCTSTSRVSATVSKSSPPSPPTGAKGSSFCKGDPISQVSVDNPGDGFRIDWFDAKIGGNFLGSGTSLTPGGPGIYYAEKVNINNSCRSESRVSASVTENPAPPAPGGATGSSHCEGDQVSPVSVNNPGSGFRIEWYANPTGGSRLAAGTSFTPGGPGTYYAETLNENTSCRSLNRTAVKVTEYPAPPGAKNPVDAVFCPVDPVPPVRVDDPGAGFTIVWYKNSTGGTLASGTVSGNNGEIFTPSSKTNAEYYAEVKNDQSGCTSESRTEVSVEIDQENCSNTDFLSYSFNEQTKPATINEESHTINVEVKNGTSTDNLIADFNLPSGAVAEVNGAVQKSGVTPNDFTDPVIYTVTAADGETTQDWEVNVTVAPGTGTDFLSFNFLEQAKPTEIDTEKNTISIEVPLDTDLTDLVANFSLPEGAVATVNGVAQVSGETANDFSNKVTYVVTAQDGVTSEEWKVNVVEQKLIDNEDPVISLISMPDEYPVSSDSVLASIVVNDDVKVRNVVFRYKKYQETAWNEEDVPLENSLYTFPINKEVVGSHGILYYFKAYDLLSNTDSTEVVSMILRFNDQNSPDFPDLQFGSSVENYQIVSIPLTLDNADVGHVFDELMPYDIKSWRLFHYSDTITEEYKDGFSTIEPGKGYWLIIRNQTEINTGGGITTRMEDPAGLTILLKPGWNQVGNPYNFNISWNDVILFNAGQEMNRIKLYNNGELQEADRMPPFSGGFVFSSGEEPVRIHIPPNTAYRNDRVFSRSESAEQNSINSQEWYLSLTVINGKFKNSLNGIGMHPEATPGFDSHDEPLLPVPREISGFDMYFLHPDEKYERISRDIVTSGDFHTWEFEIIKYNSPGDLMLQWENVNFGDNRYELILTDLSGKNQVNMRNENTYSFHARGVHKFRIYYGTRERLSQEIMPMEVEVGEIYPNPFEKALFVPVTLPDEPGSYRLSISVSDLQGRKIQDFSSIELGAGIHEIPCELHESNGNSGSFYIFRINISSGNFEQVVYRKILKF